MLRNWIWGAAALIAGCGDCGEGAGGGAAHVRRGAVDPPGDLVWEIDVAGGRSVLGAIRERLPAGLSRTVVPGTPAGLVERLAPGVAEVADRVPDASPVVIVRLRMGEDERTVGAARVTLEEGETAEQAPLGAGVTLVDGGPLGSRFIGARQAPGEPTAVLLDDAIVFADDEDSLGVAIQYVVDSRLPRVGREEGVTVRLPAGASAQLRLVADAALTRAASGLREAAARERARHAEPPALGEPEAVIDAVQERLAAWIALLPDFGEVRGRIVPAGDSLELAINADVAPGSALFRRLRGRRVGGLAQTVGHLPRDTAVAVAWDLGRIVERDETDAITPALVRIAGDRMSDEDRTAWTELEADLDQARGRTRVLAAGGDATRAWAWRWERAPEGAAPPVMQTTGARPFDAIAELRSSLRGVVETRWAGVAGGTALGCAAGIDAGTWRTGANGESALQLCTGGDADPAARSLVLAAPGQVDTWLSIERLAPDAAGPRIADGPSTGGALGDDADVARQLAGLRDAELAVAVIVPERIPAALSLAMPPLRQRAAAASPSPAAVVIGVGRSEVGLRVRVRAGPAGIESALGLAGPFLSPQDPPTP